MLLITQSGPFGLLAVAVGLAGLGVVVAQTVTRRDLQDTVALCAAVAFLLGLAGTGIGLKVAGGAAVGFEGVQLQRFGLNALGIAASTTAVGSLVAVADLLVLALATLVRPPHTDPA